MTHYQMIPLEGNHFENHLKDLLLHANCDSLVSGEALNTKLRERSEARS